MVTGPLRVYLDDLGQPYVTDEDPAPVGTPTTWTPRQVVHVPPPGPGDLFRFLGWPPPDVEQTLAAQAHLDRARLMVLAYVRGRGTNGDHMAEELAAVVLSLGARSLSNPTSDSRVTAGTYAATPGLPEFTLSERLVLDGWRRRAA